jgi:PEP-CTERM motif
MTFTRLHAIAATLALSGFCATVSATDLGVLNATPSVSVVAHLAPSITFADKYFFSLAADSTVSAGATDVRVAFSDLTILGIDQFMLKLFSSADVLLSTAVAAGPTMTIAEVALAPHSYYFQVSGNTVGLNGGYYAFAAQAMPLIPTSSVPEPASMALFGLGLLVVGAARARRVRTN